MSISPDILEVLPNEFDSSVLASEVLSVVYFRSGKADRCRTMDAMFKAAYACLKDEVNFWVLDVDQHPILPAIFSISVTPTLLAFYRGQIVARIAGLPGDLDLVRQIRSLLPKPLSSDGNDLKA